MNHYQRYSNCVLQIRQIKKNKDCFCGTGFLVGDSTTAEIKGNKVYRIVTNRHIAEEDNLLVVSNLSEKIKSKIDTKNERWFKKTIDSMGYEWCFHEKKEIDVASTICPIAFSKSKEKGITIQIENILAISDDDFMPLNDLDEGDEVYFLGFPTGLGTYEFPEFRPILRRGIISFKKNHSFLIDGFCFPGNSGSPVFLTKKYDGSK